MSCLAKDFSFSIAPNWFFIDRCASFHLRDSIDYIDYLQLQKTANLSILTFFSFLIHSSATKERQWSHKCRLSFDPATCLRVTFVCLRSKLSSAFESLFEASRWRHFLLFYLQFVAKFSKNDVGQRSRASAGAALCALHFPDATFGMLL